MKGRGVHCGGGDDVDVDDADKQEKCVVRTREIDASLFQVVLMDARTVKYGGDLVRERKSPGICGWRRGIYAFWLCCLEDRESVSAPRSRELSNSAIVPR